MQLNVCVENSYLQIMRLMTSFNPSHILGEVVA